jgi:hypothetical protein
MKSKNFNLFKKYLLNIAFFTAIFLLISRLVGSFIDPDMWWHIKLGENILNGSLANNLTFTCTEYIWINHSWLSDVLISFFNSKIGFLGLSIIFSIITLIGIIFNYLSLRLILKKYKFKINRLFILVYLCSVIYLLSAFIAIRPQLFTFAFINILFFALLKIYYAKKLKFIHSLMFLPLFILWTNLHGGFVVGIALILIVTSILILKLVTEDFKLLNKKLILKRIKYSMILAVIFLFVSLLNPYTYNLWIELINQLFGSNNSNYISEWRSINLKYIFDLSYFVIFVLGLIFIALNKKINKLRLILFIIFGLTSLYSVRYVLPLGSIVLVIFFVEFFILLKNIDLKLNLTTTKEFKLPLLVLKLSVRFIVLIFAFFSFAIAISYIKSLEDLITKDNLAMTMYPVEAEIFLEKNISALKNIKFFNSYVWGGYLKYNIKELNIFIDGRMPQWVCAEGDLMRDYVLIEKLDNSWQSIVNKHNISGFIIQNNSALSTLLLESKDFKEIYKDSKAIIFVSVEVNN